MDDLDHSIHIAEYDWTSFYEESEECSLLLQPSLACPDNSSLSDSEDTESSSSVFNAGWQEPQHRPAANNDASESNTTGFNTEEESCTGCIVQLNQNDTGGQQDYVTTKAEEDSVTQVDSEIYLDGGNTAEHITEVTNDVINKLQSEVIDVQASVQTESNTCNFKSIHEPDLNVNDLNVNEPLTAERAEAVSEEASSAPLKAEKERWFVTVNYSPVQHRSRVASMKKKRRQKKPYKHIHRQENTLGYGFESEINRDKRKSEEETDIEFITQLHQNSGGHLSAEINPECFQKGHVSSLTSGEEDNVSHSPKENTKPTIDRNKYEICSLADTFTSKGLSQLQSVESDEFEDGVEFSSIHSYDSESYLSAAESVEESLHPIKDQHMENQQMQCNADSTQDREMHSCDGTLSSNAAATNCESYESDRAYVEPTPTFPSAGRRADKTPNDNSTCDNDTHSTEPHMHSDTPGLQQHELLTEVNPASGFSLGDQLGSLPLPVPNLTVTPCSVADSPETYTEATNHSRPVYAISAFWDEMEKLTINDILQLRIARSTPHRETQETVKPNVDAPMNSSSPVETEEYHLSDVGLMDMSDAADSDYCTQPDESKPDRSSCDFSTSDFEEDYWQFISASRNPSPDLCSKTQHSQRTTDSPFSAHDEDGSTSSEGKETPVPLEDFDEWPRRMTKSKSVRNVQALNSEDLSLQSLLGSDEGRLFLNSCQSREENVVLNLNDSVEILTPAPILSNTDALDEHYRISFPEVFEYFFMQDKAKNDPMCVTDYDPEDLSVAPAYDYTLCSFGDKISFSSLHDSRDSEGKPIPIFSCSHPTVRELTFPKPDYVFLNTDPLQVDNISPMRVVSHSLIQASDCVIVGSGAWKSLLSIRKIRFHDKGSIWCRGSGAWVFPFKAEKSGNAQIPVLSEGRVCSAPSQVFRELAVQQRMLDTVQATKQEGMFTTLKQSDICLVCIAFASWVLTSSDPKAADAWKAALLANVSALSAIKYLRQYVKKNPLHDDP
ncbi:hypothetical protein PAMP_017441 [Pampus punctatissimus]